MQSLSFNTIYISGLVPLRSYHMPDAKPFLDRLLGRKDDQTRATVKLQDFDAMADFIVEHLPDEDRSLLQTRCVIDGKGEMKVRWRDDADRIQVGTKFSDTIAVVRSVQDTASAHHVLLRAFQDPRAKYQIGPYEFVWKGAPIESVFDRYTVVGSSMAASDARKAKASKQQERSPSRPSAYDRVDAPANGAAISTRDHK